VTKMEEICQKLKVEIINRLLSVDLITDKILGFYFTVVRMLNILDKESIHYKEIITPIRQYLIKRTDILRAIIAVWKESLSSDSGEKFRVLDVANYNHYGLESDDDELEADNWDVQTIGTKEHQTSKTCLSSTQI
jgi:hypothetical protein